MAATLRSTAPILAVGDVDVALEHYRRLGFEVEEAIGFPYAFATRDGVQLHLSYVAPHHHGHDPHAHRHHGRPVYLYVDDPDALYVEWREADAGGKLSEPVDTAWGMREGEYEDPDGNVIRYGRPLA